MFRYNDSPIQPVQFKSVEEVERTNPLGTMLSFLRKCFTELHCYKPMTTMITETPQQQITDILNSVNNMTEADGIDITSVTFLGKDISFNNGKTVIILSILQEYKGDRDSFFYTDELYFKNNTYLVNAIYLKEGDDYTFFLDNLFDATFNLFAPVALVGVSNDKKSLKVMQVLAPFIMVYKSAINIVDTAVIDEFVINKLNTLNIKTVVSNEEFIEVLKDYANNFTFNQLYDECGILFLLQNYPL